ncbi:MAG: carbohydrate transporter rane protein 2, family [Chloroflexi bacterium]|nr:carbohydrate transporter rane protein 2, family [Chloroflexota bacterium]
MDNQSQPGTRLASGAKTLALGRRGFTLPVRTAARLKIGIVFAVLCALGAVVLIPILWMVSTSLKADADIFTNPPTWIPSPIQWHNYTDVVSNCSYGNCFSFGANLKNSLTVTIPVVIGVLLSSSIVAYSLARINWPGRNILFGLVLATMMIPNWVTIIPLYLIFNKIGWIGTFLPLQIPGWTGDAFSIFLLRQFFSQLPQEMFDSAAIDGANHFGIFWRLVLPLSKPVLSVVVLFSFMNTWTDFLNPLIYLSDPSMNTLMLGQFSFFGTHATAWSQLMASNVMILAPLVILFFFTQRLFIEGITFTGLRG